MSLLQFVSSLLVLLVVVTLVVVAAVAALVWLFVRRLRQKNQVSTLAASDAPAAWALLPAGQAAGQHRKLQQIVREARAAAAQAGGASFEVGDAAHDIETQAVALDRQVVATSRMTAGAERAKRLYALDDQIAELQAVTHKLTDLSLRYLTSSANPESTRERFAAIEASLAEMEQAKAAADSELAELNRPVTGGVRAQMQAAQAGAGSGSGDAAAATATEPEPAVRPGQPKPTPRIRSRY